MQQAVLTRYKWP